MDHEPFQTHSLGEIAIEDAHALKGRGPHVYRAHPVDRLAALPKPACFDSTEHWHLYLAVSRGEKPETLDYCVECCFAYQARMRAESRCAWPTVVFKRSADGEVVGHRPPKKLGRSKKHAQ